MILEQSILAVSPKNNGLVGINNEFEWDIKMVLSSFEESGLLEYLTDKGEKDVIIH